MVSPDDLIARHGILNALANHSRGVDRADANLLGSAYHADATVDYGFFSGPAATLVDILAGAQKAALPTLHRTSNCWIKAQGPRATAESYVIAYVEEPDLQRWVMGRYLDTLECRENTWALTHRTYVLDGNVNRPNSAVRADPPTGFEHFVPAGGKGAADPGRALLAFHSASAGAITMTATPNREAALEAAIARAEIHDLLMAYARGVDRADEALLASIFTDDSTVISGVVNGSGAAFARDITAFVRTNLEMCFHSVANEWIDVRGDEAVGEHYVIAQMVQAGTEVLTGGRYIDRYQRRDGKWLIHSRTFVADWSHSHPSTMERDGFYEALTNRGCFGPSDPVYAHWAA
ncbi:nuclear transport factor 2 family protein [Novosphingobium sp.]|uniref:nuclear transport factor 2 family protein n=1 Tax=Novosphingobium sp. TaxID=1874826 RepID=UPI00262D9D3C|nr:nuclear transport factor 2 family protein [Novosphingobium sp.]